VQDTAKPRVFQDTEWKNVGSTSDGGTGRTAELLLLLLLLRLLRCCNRPFSVIATVSMEDGIILVVSWLHGQRVKRSILAEIL